MKLKIRTKIIVASTVLYSSLLIVVLLLSFHDTLEHFNKIYFARLSPYMDYLVQTVIENRNDIANINHSSIGKHIYNSPEKITYRLFNKNFEILTPEIFFFDYEDLIENMKNRIYSDVYSTNDEMHHYFVIIREVELNDDDTLYLAISSEAHEFDSADLKHRVFFLISAPIFILLITFISFYISKAAFIPVKKMVDDAKRIRASELHKRISLPEPEDEIKELGKTLNSMLESIEESFNSQKRFIADASHEIKTPLTILRSRLELLGETLKDTEGREEIKNLLPEIDRLSRLAKSLLLLARLDNDSVSIEKKIIRLDEMIIELVANFQAASKLKNIKILLHINEAIEISANEEKIKSLLFNIIDNAIKYSLENGQVEVELVKEKNMALFKIMDNGTGIKKEDMPYIFKRFYRSDDVRAKLQGSGLGLAIVEEIVKQHNGSIKIKSRPAEGTSVRVRLPL